CDNCASDSPASVCASLSTSSASRRIWLRLGPSYSKTLSSSLMVIGTVEESEAYAVDQSIAKNDDSLAQLDRLSDIAQDVVKRCRAAGASDAEVGASIDVGLSVNARLGEVETIEHTRDRSVGVTVYFGKRKGSASTADLQPDSIA